MSGSQQIPFKRCVACGSSFFGTGDVWWCSDPCKERVDATREAGELEEASLRSAQADLEGAPGESEAEHARRRMSELGIPLGAPPTHLADAARIAFDTGRAAPYAQPSDVYTTEELGELAELAAAQATVAAGLYRMGELDHAERAATLAAELLTMTVRGETEDDDGGGPVVQPPDAAEALGVEDSTRESGEGEAPERRSPPGVPPDRSDVPDELEVPPPGNGAGRGRTIVFGGGFA